MSEQDPEESSFYFTVPEGDIEATVHNASLFMFWGELSSRNHVWVQSGEGDETYGRYMFGLGEPWFDQVAAHMISNGFTCHINLRQVAECDETVYQQFIDEQVSKEDIPEFMPDEWENG